MKKWLIVLLVLGVVVGISGCTSSDTTDYETPTDTSVESTETPTETTDTSSSEDTSSSSTGTGASNCPVCGLPGEFRETDMYWCEGCGILWIVDYDLNCKWASSILDYEDDYQITEDEMYMVPL